MAPTVRITRRLVETLSGGKISPQLSTQVQAEERQSKAVPVKKYPAVEKSHLRETVHYGNLLLKHEGNELRQVNEFADDLIKHEYVSPQKPIPCQSERQACFSCYKENKEDLSACSKVVREYHQCSQLQNAKP